MSLLSKAGLLRRIRRGSEARARLVESNLAKGIAFQIRATRDKRGWSQADLARAIGMSQNNVSRLENPEYGKYTLSSLKRIAEALDVGLVVRFVPFSQYIDWLSGTSHLDEGLRPEALAVPSFDDQQQTRAFDLTKRYWECSISQNISGTTAYAPPSISFAPVFNTGGTVTPFSTTNIGVSKSEVVA